MNLKSSDRIMIMGQTGSGKSHLLKKIIQEQSLPVVVYDDEDEHADLNVERYVPKYLSDEARIAEFDNYCRRIFNRRNLVFVVENVDQYSPSLKPVPTFFRAIIKKGRKKGIGVIMTTQRIADVNKFPCSQCTHWYIFNTISETDLVYLRRFVGKDAYKAPKLPDYYFLYWNKKGSQTCSPIGA